MQPIYSNIIPKAQIGDPVYFRRRKSEESEIPRGLIKEGLFDFIRMLDAEGYPRAFINYGGFKFEFTRPVLRTDKIICDVTITEVK
jgi:methionyl-tRNA formyltransferase